MFNLDNYPRVKRELDEVNDHLHRLLQSDNETMQEVLDWILSSGGKMIRPTLTLLSSKLKRETTNATELAAVIEICHTASLIHDDVIDQSDYRRGHLSVQKKFGPAMAVYAGDYLLFICISRTELVKRKWYRELFSDLEEICNGEIGQLDNRYNEEIDEEAYFENISGKTAILFSTACAAGGYEGGLKNEEIEAVKAYGKNIGIIFQLRDDLLDYLANNKEARKTTQSDFRYGYYTLPAICAFRDPAVSGRLKEIARAIKSGGYEREDDLEIRELINKSGGFDYTVEKIKEYADKAKAELRPFKDSIAKEKMIEIVDVLIESSVENNFAENH